MDDFNIPDECIDGSIGILSNNKIINAAMDGFISLKDARKDLVTRIEKRVHNLDRIVERMEKRRARIARMMDTAPFRRRMDKFAYVLGTTILISYSYLIGKYPNTHIYTYVTLIQSVLLAHRYYSYSFSESHYVMYLFDFCYIANFLLLVLINFAP
mmetsp:Transcript_15147/g.18097  ORF Transcript_15147/g.18097 Transcript_15147/m.18097 type:complete len:156 (+) Transcript_15147:427-894(+)